MKNKNPIPQPRSPSKSSTTFKNIVSEKEHGFTLIEIIIVIIIVGILAAVGLSQYSTMVEKGRLAEAKMHIGTMKQLATEYYWEKGSLDAIADSDVGVNNTCTPDSFYKYYIYSGNPMHLFAHRCTSGGKEPQGTNYRLYLYYNPATGWYTWHCQNGVDSSGCFGYPH